MSTLIAVVPIDECFGNLSEALKFRTYSKTVKADIMTGLSFASFFFENINEGDIEPTKNLFKEAFRSSPNRNRCVFGMK